MLKLIYHMICVQVQVNYSTCIVDKIVFFLANEILKLICGRINYCLYCRLCLLNWLETLLYLLNMDLVRITEVYVLLSVEETDVSKMFHLHL